MVMLPGYLTHGTPDLETTGCQVLARSGACTHGGHGCVIVTKANMLSEAAMVQLKDLKQLLASAEFGEAVRRRRLFSLHSPYYCPICSPSQLCSKCSRALRCVVGWEGQGELHQGFNPAMVVQPLPQLLPAAYCRLRCTSQAKGNCRNEFIL